MTIVDLGTHLPTLSEGQPKSRFLIRRGDSLFPVSTNDLAFFYSEDKNNIQRRPQINGNGIGLNNLRQQYQLMGKDIKIDQGEKNFAVYLPFV